MESHSTGAVDKDLRMPENLTDTPNADDAANKAVTATTTGRNNVGVTAMFRVFSQYSRQLLLAAIALQIVILLTMTTLRARPLLTGQTVRLHVVPVDPRDFFRGDYVILSYDFSRKWPTDLPTSSVAKREYGERPVYVVLEPEADGLHWTGTKVTIERPTDGLYLQGRMVSPNHLEFGIESFYVQEGTGHQYEEVARTGNLSAEVAVADDGTAALRALHID